MATDPIALLVEDHRRAAALLQRLSSAAAPSQREALARQVITALRAHSRLEERHFYPRVRKDVEWGADVDDHEAEHAQLDERLERLARTRGDDPGFTVQVQEIVRTVRHHVEEEEGFLMQRVRQQLSAEQLARLGEKLEKAHRAQPQPR